ncbi:MAG: 2-dehydropantoate 2-reductase [Parasporobacterium sp.]|nr:2-dehydropantoate 2-reductase [Parasporobacterium sp.]
MKYLVIGAGGAGGVLGAALAEKGYDVTLIARGKHLKAMNENGLVIHQLWDDEEKTIPVKALSEEEYRDTADVIFICVKGYSIPDVIPFLKRASSPDTVIIPILNIYTTGETLREALPERYILDGCIYVSSNIEEPGRILKHSKILRVIFGTNKNQKQRPVLSTLEAELNEAEIRGILSSNIRRDCLKKFCYVSPIGAAGLYFNASAGSFQKEGPERELYVGMMKEIEALAAAMGCAFDTDVISANLNIVEHQPPEATTSMQRDVLSGGPSEIQGLVHDIPKIGAQYQLEMPLYRKVSNELKARFGG